jgi:hypothetical protein
MRKILNRRKVRLGHVSRAKPLNEFGELSMAMSIRRYSEAQHLVVETYKQSIVLGVREIGWVWMKAAEAESLANILLKIAKHRRLMDKAELARKKAMK